MASYDRAVTIFSPDGHLLQVEYAQEAVLKGSTAIGIRGDDYIILAVERRAVAQLQEERTVRKICVLDEHVIVAFAGLTADARVLIQRAQAECQSYKLTVEDSVTVEYITRFIAMLKQKYTQSNGRRPFGVSCIIGGFNPDGTPHLYQTEPSGVYYEWKANVTGRCSRDVREFLEEHYKDGVVLTQTAAIKLAIRALMDVAQGGQKNLEIAVLVKDKPLEMLESSKIEEYKKVIEKEKEEADKKKPPKKT